MHVSRRRPALPCHRHRRPYFCCGTTAHAFAECRLAVVSGWVVIPRSMPPTAKALTFLGMLARFSLQRRCKANVYRAPGLFHYLRLLDEHRPPERLPLSNDEELRFDEGSTQRAHWAGPSRAAPTTTTTGLAHRQTDNLKSAQTDRQTDRQTIWQIDRQTDV